MKNLRAVSSLLLASALLLVSNALGQANNPLAGNETLSSVAVARCAYTADHACVDESDPAQTSGRAIDDATVAQLPRRGPGPSFGSRGLMRRPGYPAMWQSQPSARHALIGAVIGAALGWAVAAKGNAGARATLGIATIGAGLGAGMGAAVPSFPSRSPYWRRWPDDDEEASAHKSAKPGRNPIPQKTAFAEATPPNPRPSAEDAPSAKATAP